ncbi:hypothetical protein B6N60_01939 [Richelia sinica FACHB-800]|uniref:Uncharacterized protein n=1 Tax=Richelia sinica FACHB-800 TaxID=1357546 RepID=A0A975Y4J7_9NOST|nr:hypothetical protein B6N60_01939 [Richelia sinica FACHB-800]
MDCLLVVCILKVTFCLHFLDITGKSIVGNNKTISGESDRL